MSRVFGGKKMGRWMLGSGYSEKLLHFWIAVKYMKTE